jgi:hypothetical protein
MLRMQEGREAAFLCEPFQDQIPSDEAGTFSCHVASFFLLGAATSPFRHFGAPALLVSEYAHASGVRGQAVRMTARVIAPDVD